MMHEHGYSASPAGRVSRGVPGWRETLPSPAGALEASLSADVGAARAAGTVGCGAAFRK